MIAAGIGLLGLVTGIVITTWIYETDLNRMRAARDHALEAAAQDKYAATVALHAAQGWRTRYTNATAQNQWGGRYQ